MNTTIIVIFFQYLGTLKTIFVITQIIIVIIVNRIFGVFVVLNFNKVGGGEHNNNIKYLEKLSV